MQEGGDISIHIADSLRCTAETNTMLQSNYTHIYIYKKKDLGGNGFLTCLRVL